MSKKSSTEYSHLGGYRLIKFHEMLRFDEFYPARMINIWKGVIETKAPTRFFQRKNGWSGKGIEASPRVHAEMLSTDGSDNFPLAARRHGPIYREGNNEFYLVDLGKTIPEGRLISLEMQSMFVDEASSFSPYLVLNGKPTLEEAVLEIQTKEEVMCKYTFNNDGKKRTEGIKSKYSNRHFSYQKKISNPTQGEHSLNWVFSEASKMLSIIKNRQA